MNRARAVLLLLVFLACALIVGAVFRYPLVLDDPFITFRYARNLIQGHGMVFNPGERVLSTTTPLYTLILAALGLVYGDIPTLGFWLSVLSLGVCAYCLYRIAELYGMRTGGVLAALVTLVSPALVMTFGLETGLYLALATSAFYAYLRQRVTLAFVLLALLTLTRNDGVLLAGILGLHYVWTTALNSKFAVRNSQYPLRSWREIRNSKLKIGIMNYELRISNFQFLIPYFVLLLPWLLFAWWWFGTPFPFTLTAKIAQAQSGLWDTFAVGLIKWARASIDWLAPMILLALAALTRAALTPALSHRERERGTYSPLPLGEGQGVRGFSLLLFPAWALAHLVAYALLRVAFYPWYVAPLIPALALLAGIGAERIGHAIGERAGRPRAAGLIFVAVVGLAVVLFELRADVAAGMMRPTPQVTAYERAAEWIAANSPPTASVDALEVGLIGYYDDRRTTDFVGLVDPMRIPYLRAREFAAGVRRAAADYVIAIPPDTWLPADLWFPNAYQPVQRIRVPGYYGDKPLVIYQRGDAGRAAIETRQVNLSFDQRVELQAIDVFVHEIARGEILPIRLNLQARTRERVPESWKFTLQLVGAENRIIAQTDNYYPARLPEDGVPFADYQGIPIPADAPPGTYDLILALYDVDNGERMSLYDALGNDVGDFVSLGQVRVF